MQFDKKEGDEAKYSLHREGGHSTHRILHTKDLTGAEIMRALIERVRQEPNITILENWVAIDLITKGWLARRNNLLPPAPDRVLGAYALNKKNGEIYPYSAKCVAMCLSSV